MGKRNNMEAQSITDMNTKIIARPDFWIEAFLIANVFAFFQADNKQYAFTGEQGRYLGLITIGVFCLVFIAICVRVRMFMLFYVILAAAAVWSNIIAICQHMGNDFLKLRENITPKKIPIFMSTFGNINIYASFMAITIPIFICIFIFGKNLIYRGIAAVALFTGGMGMMIGNSDSVYLGVAFATVLIWIFSFREIKIDRFVLALTVIVMGFFINVLLNIYVVENYDKRGGISRVLDNISVVTVILVVMIVLCVFSLTFKSRYTKLLNNIDISKATKYMAIVLFGGIVLVVVIGFALKLPGFVMNDKWGNYRGFIWRLSKQIYKDAPMVNKLFGYGNETVRALTTASYYDEMLATTKTIYDNCHNELLQYLLTTGLVGVITYVGVFVSSFCYILKHANREPIAYLTLASMLGYIAQAMVNVNQPITTPYFYVITAVGVGYVRFISSTEE
ncbi:MAG: O-antigen ligase family protein [Wujia sp.]